MKNLIKNTILVVVMVVLGLFLIGCEKSNIEPETLTITTYSFTGDVSPVATKKFISTETVFKKDVENGFFTKKVKSLSGLRLAFTVKHNYDGVQFTPEQLAVQILGGYLNSPYEYVEGGSEENIEYMIEVLSGYGSHNPFSRWYYLKEFLITQ